MNERIKSAKSSFGKFFTRRKSVADSENIASEENKNARCLKQLSQGSSSSVENEPLKIPEVLPKKYKKQKLRKNSSPCEMKISKKEMMSDWNASYEQMCQRAEMLNLAIKTAEKDELAVKPVTRFTTEPGQGSKRCKTFFSVHSVSSAGIDNSQDCEGTGASGGTAVNVKDERDNCKYLHKTQSLDGIEI